MIGTIPAVRSIVRVDQGRVEAGSNVLRSVSAQRCPDPMARSPCPDLHGDYQPALVGQYYGSFRVTPLRVLKRR